MDSKDKPLMEIAMQNWKVGDIIRAQAHSGGYRVWRVIGVFLGATHQESVVELETLDRTKNTEGRIIVPVEMMDNAVGVSVG